MRRLAEGLVFGAVAVALHLLAFAAAPEGGAEAGGAGGEARVTLAAASPRMARMVAEWDRPPEAASAPAAAAPARAAADSPPPAAPAPGDSRAGIAVPEQRRSASLSRDARPAAPEDPPQAERETAPPAAERSEDGAGEAPPPAVAPEAAPSPLARPQPPGREAAQAPAAEPEAEAGEAEAPSAGQRAAGEGGAPSAGQGTASEALPEGEAARLARVWGAEIRRAIIRQARAPRGVRGEAVVAIAVTPTGELLESGLRRASDTPALDRAVLRAVRAAAPFPPAPEGLSAPSYRFLLPVRLR
ncbi:MAG: TonB family protein [Pseudomonadota bacterium]